jgi:hypothetical protein
MERRTMERMKIQRKGGKENVQRKGGKNNGKEERTK